MSTFEVLVQKIDDVQEHPNADRLSIVKIKGYTCIANKLEDGSPRYKTGDLVVYIPEAAVLPEWLLKKMGFWKDDKGTLAGSGGNRVKAMKLRGIFSLGVLYPVGQQTFVDYDVNNTDYNIASITDKDDNVWEVHENQNVAEYLGIVKYEVPVPAHLSGEVCNLFGYTVKYDIENIQKYPDVFTTEDDVYVTEKLHGTMACIAYNKELDNPELLEGKYFAYSKGLGGNNGLVFKNNEKNQHVVYQKALLENIDALKKLVDLYNDSVYVFGEIFGKGIQDLSYGLDKPTFRVFDVYVGNPSQGRWLNYQDMVNVNSIIATVPTLYTGKFDKEVIEKLRDEKSVLSPNQIKEGVVIRRLIEKSNFTIGRSILKDVSPNYLLRKGETTEYN
jgi:RNA ligase (TIGR02306 family)